MMNKPRVARRSLAESAANSLLYQMGINGLRVDPIAIAEKKGIFVQAKPDKTPGVSGMLIKAGDNFGIIYATDIESPGFQRFSICHELGHYFIEGHAEALLSNGMHTSLAGFLSADPFEQEADHFAAALLMPAHPFKKAIEYHEAGLTCIEALAKTCETSLTATAIRYCNLTRDAVAVVMSSGQTIDWCFMSDNLKDLKNHSFLRKGTPLPVGTLTSRFNADTENIRLARREADTGRLNDWMGGERVRTIKEEVVGLGIYDRTLTVLTCKALSARVEGVEDEDDEEVLIESWTPKFRR